MKGTRYEFEHVKENYLPRLINEINPLFLINYWTRSLETETLS